MTRLLAALLALASPTLAQTAPPVPCADHATLAARLAAGWGEVRESVGLTSDGRVVELYANPETRTWTAVVTTPDGIACLVASGEHFEWFRDFAEPMPGEPA